jgi:DUF3040 family protein
MALSRYEQRVPAEIEKDLAARPASRGIRHWWRRWQSERAATRGLTGGSAAAGLTLLAVGLVSANGIGVVAALIGYALTVLATLSAVTHRLQTRAAHQRARPPNPSPR